MNISAVNLNKSYALNVRFGNSLQQSKDDYTAAKKVYEEQDAKTKDANKRLAEVKQNLKEREQIKSNLLAEDGASKAQIIKTYKDECSAKEQRIIEALVPMGILEHAKGWIGFKNTVLDCTREAILKARKELRSQIRALGGEFNAHIRGNHDDDYYMWFEKGPYCWIGRELKEKDSFLSGGCRQYHGISAKDRSQYEDQFDKQL